MIGTPLTFEQVYELTEPLIIQLSAAQKEWMLTTTADGMPTSGISLVALVAIANAFARAMEERGFDLDYIQECIRAGTLIARGITISNANERGGDA